MLGPIPASRECASVTTSSSGGTMEIKDPERFWSASGWLIVVYD